MGLEVSEVVCVLIFSVRIDACAVVEFSGFWLEEV